MLGQDSSGPTTAPRPNLPAHVSGEHLEISGSAGVVYPLEGKLVNFLAQANLSVHNRASHVGSELDGQTVAALNRALKNGKTWVASAALMSYTTDPP